MILGSLLLIAAALVLAGCAAQSKKAQQPVGATVPPGTATVTFRPYTPQGKIAARVEHVARGECWTTSIAAPVPGAYRCFEGNKILDPCFAPAHVTTPLTLACLAAPWSPAVELRVVGALPKPAAPNPDGTRPWAFLLASGVRCVASTGTVPEVQNVNLAYSCTDGGNAALAAAPGPYLTADHAAPSAQTLQRVRVTTVWHA